MESIVVPVFVLLIFASPIASFVWQFGKIRRGSSSRLKAIVSYAVWSAAPVLLYVCLFFVLVGIEEFFSVPLIGEEYARSLLLVVGGGLTLAVLGTVLFLIVVLYGKSKTI